HGAGAARVRGLVAGKGKFAGAARGYANGSGVGNRSASRAGDRQTGRALNLDLAACLGTGQCSIEPKRAAVDIHGDIVVGLDQDLGGDISGGTAGGGGHGAAQQVELADAAAGAGDAWSPTGARDKGDWTTGGSPVHLAS